ncbi:MAG TPA: 1-acyl-sn-glycerol-3-phosphate acyltransferase [Solirubrobacterales bacterium]|jgi:1-acyl-sn-glycerol-3-phosphate acyltransferase|nr:1-acyl-sn-glycerol-3-phosphate acyltransferase [Solirubrobacterales bacterium]
MDEERLLSYHRFTREHGVNWLMYVVARLVLQPFLLVYFRLSRIGREHAKVHGPLIVASNHRSFLDPFVIGATLPGRRPLHYVAKVELFEPRWQGWILNRLGAYPVRRGQSDEETLITSRGVLDRSGAICIFPEGTRIRTGSLGRPKRGFGRLALETGAAVLPVAVHGTERIRDGWRIRPRKVRVRAGRALTFPRTDDPSPQLANSVGARIWPVIELQWEWLGGLPPLRKAAVIGAGSWGTAVAVLLARGGLEVQLGCRTEEQAAEIAERRTNERYLPGIQLPDSIQVKRASEIELAGMDLVCLGVPSKGLPAAVGAIGDRVGQRTAVLMLSKGLVAPMGALPSEYVAERVRARAIACLGGPAHAKEAVSGTAALVLGSDDADLRAQLGEVFDEAGLVCERTSDVAGVEMAGVAKNAAAMAAAAAVPHGMNAAGIATAEVWRECMEYAQLRGGGIETFSGLAGIGDLTATILAPGSRNRRAGELLGRGTPVEQIPAIIGQASESLDSVPLIATTLTNAGIDAPGIDGLARLMAAEISPGEWMAGLRRAERARREAA